MPIETQVAVDSGTLSVKGALNQVIHGHNEELTVSVCIHKS